MNNFFHVNEGKTNRGAACAMDRYITGKRRPPEYVVAVFEGNMPPGVTRQRFWKLNDERLRTNGLACRTIKVALSRDVPMLENIELAKAIVDTIAAGRPYSGAIHEKPAAREGGRQPHFHAMISQLVPDGIERSIDQICNRYNPANPARGGWRKVPAEPLPVAKRALVDRRRICAEALNAVQDRHGLPKVDHRSNAQRGLPPPTQTHIGPARLRRVDSDILIVHHFS